MSHPKIKLGDKQCELRYSVESIQAIAKELHVSVDRIGDKIREDPDSFNTLAVITWAALVTSDTDLKLGQVRQILLNYFMEERAKQGLIEAIDKALTIFDRDWGRTVKAYNKVAGPGNLQAGPALSIPGRKRH